VQTATADRLVIAGIELRSRLFLGTGKYADNESMLAALDQGHGGFPMGSRAKLAANRAYLEAAIPVVRVAADAPLPPVDGRLPAAPADARLLARLDERWDLGSSLARMCGALAARPD